MDDAPLAKTPAESESQSPWELDDLGIFGLVATDRSLSIRYWNNWMATHSDLTAEQVIGKPLFEVFPSLLERKLDKLYHMALEGQPTVLAHRIHKFLFPLHTSAAGLGEWEKDEHRMHQRVTIVPLIRRGDVVGTITAIEDVTDRVIREEQLSQRIAAQEALIVTSRAILTLDFEDCLRRIVREAFGLVGANLVALVLKEHDKLRVACSLFEGEERHDWPTIDMPEAETPDNLPPSSHVAAW
ncbi:MAG: PAS domain-containing protein, partial [Verrucomicrobiia bacterium]